MKKIGYPFALLLFLFISRAALSQSNDEKLQLKIAPLNLLDPITGVLQVGLQKNFNQRIALSFDYGLKMNIYAHSRDKNNERKNYKYSKSKLELKYFTNLKNGDSLSRVAPYLSIEGMYFPQKYVKEDDWIFRGSESYRYEYSKIKRTVWVVSLKIGTEIRYRRIIFDQYIGVGIRKMFISHQTFGEVEEIYLGPEDIYFPPIDRHEGTFYRPHLSFGLKIGYIIKE